MSRKPRRYQPAFEDLERKLALSGASSALAGARSIAQVQDSNNQDTYATLVAFTKAYPSIFGGPRYNPAFDLNHNGQVGQDDGRLLMRSLAPLSKKVPISINVVLAPQDRIRGHHPTSSGGVTYSMEPTILGHTTPGALIFTGSGTVDLKLKGPAVVADAKGNFSFKFKLSAGINQLDFQAVDPYGQQKLRAFPITWLGYRAYQLKHPKND